MARKMSWSSIGRRDFGDKFANERANEKRQKTSSSKSEALKKKKDMAGKMGKDKKSWAETHGQEEGKQLKGTITGKKFGPKSY